MYIVVNLYYYDFVIDQSRGFVRGKLSRQKRTEYIVIITEKPHFVMFYDCSLRRRGVAKCPNLARVPAINL